ncbi:MAG TPA: GNAT family N-acetyltransferase [Ktedonobacterales bacterium]
MAISEPIVIRRAQSSDARGIAEVHVTAWRETYRGTVPDAYLDSLSVDEREARWHRLDAPDNRSFAFVAVDGARHVIGFASGGPRRDGPEEYASELNAIYLLRASQGHGIGRRLVAAVARELAAREMPSMLLWVFRDNLPARRFYEALGGTLLTSQQFEIDGQAITEVSYGWLDATALYADDGNGGEKQ